MRMFMIYDGIFPQPNWLREKNALRVIVTQTNCIVDMWITNYKYKARETQKINEIQNRNRIRGRRLKET